MMKIKITNSNLTVGVSSLTPEKLSNSLRKAAHRSWGLSIDKLLKLTGVSELRKCNFCGKPVERYTFQFRLVSDCEVELCGISYLDDLFYCKKQGCPGKLLNPNSTEFVTTSRGLSKEKALEFIRSRNRSPFYRENYESDESYRAYQNIYDRLSHKKHEIVAKQNHTRSLQGYVERFGEVEGSKRWRLVQSQKAITVENLTRIYGDQARSIVEQWKLDTRQNLENFIKRYGETEGPIRHLEYLRKISKNFGRKKILHDGYEFYSKMELDFYVKLHAAGFRWVLQHDVYYPGSLMRSDFYFPLIDAHVEIAGSYFIEGYADKMRRKEELFSPIVVKSYEEYDIIIQELIKRHEENERFN